MLKWKFDFIQDKNNIVQSEVYVLLDISDEDIDNTDEHKIFVANSASELSNSSDFEEYQTNEKFV